MLVSSGVKSFRFSFILLTKMKEYRYRMDECVYLLLAFLFSFFLFLLIWVPDIEGTLNTICAHFAISSVVPAPYSLLL